MIRKYRVEVSRDGELIFLGYKWASEDIDRAKDVLTREIGRMYSDDCKIVIEQVESSYLN